MVLPFIPRDISFNKIDLNFFINIIVRMENAKIYKIINDISCKIYVGSSTCQYLYGRMKGHRQSSKDTTGHINSKLYLYMREIGVEHFKIELIEKYECKTKEELREREQYWIEELKPELNTNRAIEDPNYFKKYHEAHREERNKKTIEYYHANKEQILKQQNEYREVNKEEISKKNKEYCEVNKDKIREIKKEYREVNKEEISKRKKEFYETHKEQIKEYREKNKEQIKEYREKNKEQMKEYREVNKDKISEQSKETIICQCGRVINKHHSHRHLKTKIHLSLVADKLV